jgi:hypothetical protein
MCSKLVVDSLIVCWAWFQINARYAERGSLLSMILTERPSCRRGSVQEWSTHAVGSPSDDDRVAEQIIPADRFAHEISGFLAVILALAAAEFNRSAAL